MEPQIASYYRAILFADGQDTRPLPPTLVQLHKWAVKRHQALGLGGTVSKAVALNVALTWLSSTADGREFASAFTTLGDLFCEEPAELSDDGSDELSDELSDDPSDEWDSLPAETEVVVTMRDKSTATGQFIGRRGNWIDVRVNGTVEHFRISKVQIPVGA